MSVISCIKCGSEIEEFKGKYICVNEVCDFMVRIEDWEKENLQPWHLQVYQNQSLWFPQAFTDIPSIMAHEYRRLFELFESGQTYGAFLQLKDVLEIMIKFPSLLAISEIYLRNSRSDVENKLLLNLIEKPLSLGDWQSLASTLIKKCTFNQSIHILLTNIVDLYQKESITSWRNEKIGHGALSFDVDRGFQVDMENKLHRISEHFQNMINIYTDISIYTMVNGCKIDLIGNQYGENLQTVPTEVYFKLPNQTPLCLTPYIILDQEGIFFFDSFYPRKKKTALLCYPRGVKSQSNQDINKSFLTMFSSLSKTTDLDQIQRNSSVEDKTYSSFEAQILDKLQEINDFEKPVYLEDWIHDALNEKSKGVFLLQMERGTGKTTFSRSLDEHSIHKITLPGVSVRSYYINDSFLYKPRHFALKVNDYLRQNHRGEYMIEGIPAFSDNEANKKQSFANLLNEYQMAHYQYFGKERLLLIIDGLDEIPPKGITSIFDFLPDEKMLNEGVYLLLTCRTNKEISAFTKAKLKKLKPTRTLEVIRSDQKMIQTVVAYIEHNLKNNIFENNPKIKDWIIEHSEGRFLYIKPIIEILKLGSDITIKDIPKGEELLSFYLQKLSSLYGEKYFLRLMELFTVIGTSFEPLTFKEISKLVGEEQPTLKLLAYLLDIRGFLRVERSYRGNLISISHEQWKETLTNTYTSNVQPLLTEWIELTDQFLDDEINWHEDENDGFTYLMAHLYDYVRTFAPDNKEFTEKVENHYYTFALIAQKLSKHTTIEYQRIRTLQLYSKALEILVSWNNQGKLTNPNVIITLFMNRSLIYESMLQLDQAYHDLSEAVSILHQLESQEAFDIIDYHSYVTVLVNRGNFLRRNHELEKSLQDYTEAIQILRHIDEQGSLENKNELAIALHNRSLTLDDLNEFEKAKEDLNECIEIRRVLLDRDELEEKTDYAQSLITRAGSYRDLNEFDLAIKDYDEAILFCLQLPEKSVHRDEELASGYLYRGYTFNRQKEYAKAMKDYCKAEEILQKLAVEHKLVDWKLLPKVKMNMGVGYFDQEEFEEALKAFSEAVEMLQQLESQNRVKDIKIIADVFNNQAGTFYKLKDLPNTISSYEKAVKRLKELHQKHPLKYSGDLITAIENLSVIHKEMEQYELALAYWDETIGIKTKDNNNNWVDSMWKSYVERSLVNQKQNHFGEAIKDLQKAEKLLKRDKKVFNQYQEKWSDILIQRANLYRLNRNEESAIKEYSQALQVLKKNEGNNEKMISVLTQRLFLYNSQKNHQKELNDYHEIISLLESNKQTLEKELELSMMLLNRGQCFGLLKNNEKALEDYHSSIQRLIKLKETDIWIDPHQEMIVYMNRGTVYDKQGVYQEALSDYEHSLQIALNFKKEHQLEDSNYLATIYFNRHFTYKNLKEMEKALKDIKMAKKYTKEGLETSPVLVSQFFKFSYFEILMLVHVRKFNLIHGVTDEMNEIGFKIKHLDQEAQHWVNEIRSFISSNNN